MATKGWSFGALTDALKSAAFVDTGQAPAQVPLISSTGMLPVGPLASQLTGFYARGQEQNDVYLWTNGNRPINDMVGSFQASWYATNLNLGIIRGAGVDSLGYAFNYGAAVRYHYHGPSAQHRFTGDMVGSQRLVLGGLPNTYKDGITEKFALASTANTEFTMSHQSRTWKFTANGTIDTSGSVTAGNEGALRCLPGAGGWDNWRDRAPAVQVDLQGSSASGGIRFTLWGTGHVGVIQAAYSGNRNIMRFESASGPIMTIGQAGDGGVTIDNGGLTVTGGAIISAGQVRAGNGSAVMETNGNITGTLWGGNIYNWIVNNAMTDLGRGGQQYYSQAGGNAWESGAGCVVTGRNSVANDGRNMGFYFRQLTGRKISGAQFAIGDFA